MSFPAYPTKNYETRLDRFRARWQLSLTALASEANVTRSQLQRYRAGTAQPSFVAIAALVRAAQKLIDSPVRASDLFDLGEDEPLGKRESRVGPRLVVRRSFNTPLDALLRRERISLQRLAQEAKISPQHLRKIRTGVVLTELQTIRNLVRALRRMGIDVRAQHITDVGDGEAQ